MAELEAPTIDVLPMHYRRDRMSNSSSQYELRFLCLYGTGRGYAFPCDPQGRVDLNRLSERARNNYLYARAVVGREFAAPAVQPSGRH